MTTAARHPLVEDYLKRLWSEAARLPVDQARELVADIEEHLLAALPHDASEAEVRNVLERLGTPTALVTEAGGFTPPAVTPAARTFASPGGAIGCLVVAELLFITGPIALVIWILGLVMMARVMVWTDREKWLGFIALGSGFPASVVLAFGAVMVAPPGCASWASSDGTTGTTCGGVNWVAVIAWTVTLGYLALQAFTIWRLVRSARRR
jgi:hypothetical protein